jgi:hypothetical protein
MANRKKIKTRQVSKLQCIWGILCSLSSIDQDKNNISIFNVIDEITVAPQYFKEGVAPLTPFNYELVTVWRRLMSTNIDEKDIVADLKVELFDPNEDSLMNGFMSPATFPGKGRRTRLRLPFNRIMLTGPGDYSFHVFVKDQNEEKFEKAHEVPLEVKQAKKS